ncbi:hypothetical protein QR680_006287 [Steinernema hermaphroditum]|uniref:TIL domain-containing protein n=1 Tax=Steinernema hermaphroditum TaxID=289476 RepID=A0AA39LX56_9BILA|nr:hypothetical protein QR680_006287 [Steinernema hermaphroditum]
MESALRSALFILSLLIAVVNAQSENGEGGNGAQNSTDLLGSCNENEQWEDCTHCENHCDGGEICPDPNEQCQFPVCRCVEGYSRDSSGACIPTTSCPSTPTTPSLSTILSMLSTLAPPRTQMPEKEQEEEKAEEPEPKEDVAPSAAKAEGETPSRSREGCGENEEMTECGTCEATCTHNVRECRFNYCKQPRCQCVEGYVRGPTGKCISPSACWTVLYRAPAPKPMTPLPATVPPKCNRNCASGYMCVLGPRVYMGLSIGWQIYPVCIPEKFRKYHTHL